MNSEVPDQSVHPQDIYRVIGYNRMYEWREMPGWDFAHARNIFAHARRHLLLGAAHSWKMCHEGATLRPPRKVKQYSLNSSLCRICQKNQYGKKKCTVNITLQLTTEVPKYTDPLIAKLVFTTLTEKACTVVSAFFTDLFINFRS